MKKIAIAHLKGGVGKTSAAVNIAHLASAAGLRTLLVDLDAQGAAGYIFRVNAEDGAKAKAVARNRKGVVDHIFASDFPSLDLLPGSFSLRKLPHMIADEKDGAEQLGGMLKRAGKGYDLVVVDAPAGLHKESEAILQAMHLVLVPILPSPLSVESYRKMQAFLEKRRGIAKRPILRGFFSMVDRRRKLHREVLESVTADYPDVWPVEIPYASIVEQMTSRRLPLAALPRAGKAMAAYRSLWDHTARAVGLDGALETAATGPA
ncbi:MAG: AAA family ATPase [Spirochaetes bacterium]|jgi:cellulose biosynthesis protein BcsQ|nr:AAA family ATPase [Spirochaetota bacterium]